MSEADAAALEGISRATGGLWQVLSQCVARIETGLQAAAPEASPTGQPGSRMLPTGAAQVLEPDVTRAVAVAVCQVPEASVQRFQYRDVCPAASVYQSRQR